MKDKVGILLSNMGGPNSLEDIEPFLFNLFSDKNIIQLPVTFLQRPVARIISKARAKKVKKYYRKIGGKSPILDITKKQAEKLQDRLNKGRSHFRVFIAMRYSRPFTRDAFKEIEARGINKLVVISLYPHYSKTTSFTSLEEVRKELKGREINATFIESWPDYPGYIEALREKIEKALKDLPENPHLIFSAHGLPESYVKRGDPYPMEIKRTIKSLEESMELPEWTLAFQSQAGPVKWLGPSTQEVISALAGKGEKNLLIVPISFVSDNLETLYEIDIYYRKMARDAGIVNFKRVETLNDSPELIGLLSSLVKEKLDKLED